MDAIVIAPAKEAASVIVTTTEIATTSQPLVTAQAKLPCQTMQLVLVPLGSHSHGLRHSSYNHRLYICNDKDGGWAHEPIPISCLTKEHTTSPHWAKSPPIQDHNSVDELKLTDLAAHDVLPVSEIAAPKKIQQAQFTHYYTTPPSPEPWSGEMLDESIDSEDQ